MVLLLPIFITVLLAGTVADTKILSIPDGKLGPEPCIRTCTGVDKDYSGWVDDSRIVSGTVLKSILIDDCDFVSPPVVTVTTKGANVYSRCPSVHLIYTWGHLFQVRSVSKFTKRGMISNKCDIHWTATGFIC